MLVEPDRTRYDLSFRLFRFPVRVHPLFWLGAVLLGSYWLDVPGGTLLLLLWVAVVFLSILVHELGHAVAFRWFGSDSHVVLYLFGGLAVPWSSVPGRWRRAAVALAGPVAGFALLGVVYLSQQFVPWAATSRYTAAVYLSLIYVNLYWGVLNLLPVFPLDGGQVSREVCGMVWRSRGGRVALEISVAVAGVIVLYSLACVFEDGRRGGPLLDLLPWWFPRGGIWTAVLFGMLAVQSWQLLQHQRWTESHWDDDRPPWRR